MADETSNFGDPVQEQNKNIGLDNFTGASTHDPLLENHHFTILEFSVRIVSPSQWSPAIYIQNISIKSLGHTDTADNVTN